MLGTGIDLNIQHCPKNWQLAMRGSALERENSMLSPVQTAFGPAMLKLARETGDLQSSSAMLRWQGGAGSVRIIKDRKDMQLLEWIDGPALSSLIASNKEDLAIDILSNVVKKLDHAGSSRPDTSLVNLDDLMRPLLAQKYSENMLDRHAARLMRHLLESQSDQRPLHGDLHFDKIMHHSDRGWLAIAPKGVIGDPHFELASALSHPNGQPVHVGGLPDLRDAKARIASRAARLVKNLDLDRDRLLTFAFCHASQQAIFARRSDHLVDYWHHMSTLLLDSLVD